MVYDGTMSITAAGGNAANMKIDTRDGKLTGKTWFDPELGMLVESEMKQDINFDMEMTPPGATEPMKMSSKMDMGLVSKLTGVEDLK